MAQIVVRGIEDEVMRLFKARAKKQGKSAEQAVRELIEEAARETERQDNWLERVNAFHKTLPWKSGQSPLNSADLLREDRYGR